MQNMILVSTATALLLGTALLVSGVLQRGQPLPYADKLEDIIHKGLFPDKPREMSFVEYFQNLTNVDENMTAVLEKLEFGVLDAENLEIAIKLAEDLKAHAELRPENTRRQGYKKNEIFNYPNTPYAWNLERRDKLFQFMQHSVYSTRYEINKMQNIRKKYRNSTVFRMGLLMGHNLELKTVAATLYSTLRRMDIEDISMLWYVFHFHKLMNIAFDVTNNVEYMFLLSESIEAGFTALKAEGLEYPPPDSVYTSQDPENM